MAEDGPVGKFDMHVHTSHMSQSDLDAIILTYNIPADLHPILPDPNMTMDRLPSDKIGIYTQQLDLGGARIPFSRFLLQVIKHFKIHFSQIVPIGLNRVTLFEIRCYSLDERPTVSLFRVFYRLCKQGNWFSFESRTGRRAIKCFKEVLTGLKHWKSKFFLIDRRAIPDAMAWRHRDSKITEVNDFPLSHPEAAADRLAETQIFLRKPLPVLLWLSGLSSVWENKHLAVILKDTEGHGNAPCTRLYFSSFSPFSFLYTFFSRICIGFAFG